MFNFGHLDVCRTTKGSASFSAAAMGRACVRFCRRLAPMAENPHISVHIFAPWRGLGRLSLASTGFLIASLSFAGPIFPRLSASCHRGRGEHRDASACQRRLYAACHCSFLPTRSCGSLIAWSSVSAVAFMLVLFHLQEMDALLGWLVEWFLFGTAACLLGRGSSRSCAAIGTAAAASTAAPFSSAVASRRAI